MVLVWGSALLTTLRGVMHIGGNMQENWQYWLTTLLAVLALYNSYRARGEAKKANELVMKNQQKNELNLHYPELRFTMNIENYEANFYVENKTSERETEIISFKWYIEMSVGKHALNDEKLNEVHEKLIPLETKKLVCGKLNQHLASMRYAIENAEADDVYIRVYGWLYSKPNIYDAEKVTEMLEIRFTKTKDGIGFI